MRCAGCELEPKKPARYCECCGKEISQHQAKAPETVDTDWAPKRSAWDLRCPKCGGPSLDGGVCQVCQKPTPPADRAESSSDPNHAGAPAGVAPHAGSAEAPAATPPRSQMTSPAQHGIAAPAPQRAMPPPPLSELPTIPVARERTPTPVPRRSQTDPATPDRSRRPAVASTRRPVQSKAPSKAYSFGLIAASVAVVAALGAAADWLFVRQGAEVARAAQASMPVVSEKPAVPASEPPPSDVAPASDERPAVKDAVAADAVVPARPAPPAAPAAKDPASAKPKPVTPPKPARAAAAPAAKPVKPQGSPASAPALTAAAAPAPASSPVREPAPAASPSVAKAPPVGPFFETKDVTETPKVTERVEPRLPADLRARKVHEIVIVRALVSQNGHASRVSVLRKSKAGPQLDDVVVAAVNQWTFAPAKKKGEPVELLVQFRSDRRLRRLDQTPQSNRLKYLAVG